MKGLKDWLKKYILECIFNDYVQERWIPQVGDIIITHTGNVYVISGLHTSLRDTIYFFGGGFCNKTGGNILDETCCYTMNESGILQLQ